MSGTGTVTAAPNTATAAAGTVRERVATVRAVLLALGIHGATAVAVAATGALFLTEHRTASS
ncbi:hypothetical protein [Kitasatospora sp. NPDC057541]|uniref:hypothetical protein n=1 Tax=unclassified Kitasatospora TaxID=2633591 RepID=UPI0036797224